ncbi:uncharacterized protein ACWYII_041288 isoform 1-T1 [Salvelinus alpinus]
MGNLLFTRILVKTHWRRSECVLLSLSDSISSSPPPKLVVDGRHCLTPSPWQPATPRDFELAEPTSIQRTLTPGRTSCCQGFMELNLMEASEREGEPTDLWTCPFLIDVYCQDGRCTLEPVSLESSHRMLNTALQRPITARS